MENSYDNPGNVIEMENSTKKLELIKKIISTNDLKILLKLEEILNQPIQTNESIKIKEGSPENENKQIIREPESAQGWKDLIEEWNVSGTISEKEFYEEYQLWTEQTKEK